MIFHHLYNTLESLSTFLGTLCLSVSGSEHGTINVRISERPVFQGQRKHSMDACAMCSRTMGIKLFDFSYHRAMLYFNFCI